MKHTDLPWRKGKGGDNTYLIISPEGGWISKGHGEANAAFIVKAVNNHYQLLEALKEINRLTYLNDNARDVYVKAIKQAEEEE